ncbi:MAG: hypothetical protein JSR77_13500 [Planctomycetes bacterium]|nr:hypothetical protein [Planctomycetota bacterium]
MKHTTISVSNCFAVFDRLVRRGLIAGAFALFIPILIASAQEVEWTRRMVAGPSPRCFHAMAYDAARGVTVLFGGLTPEVSYTGDTWEWNGKTWTQRYVEGPSPRGRHAMAYDSIRGVTVLFGGEVSYPGEDIADAQTWEWNGTAWTLRADTGPSPRVDHTMAFDTVRGVTVLFGGANNDFSRSGETWEWDGLTWTLRARDGPAPQRWHAMAYDSGRGVTVLLGGDFLAPTETWEWSQSVWKQQTVPPPAWQYDHEMAYDSSRLVTVMFGGYKYYSGSSDETWEWDGSDWARRAIEGPTPRHDHAMAYDSGRSVTVLFGGDNYPEGMADDTWELGAPCAAPVFTAQPIGGTFYAGEEIVLTASLNAATGVRCRWQHNGSDLTDSANYSGSTTLTLRINATDQSQSGSYTISATNSCGTAKSDAAVIEIDPCLADFNDDGGVDIDDVSMYFAYWESGVGIADVNRDGGIDGADVQTFFIRWEGGSCE